MIMDIQALLAFALLIAGSLYLIYRFVIRKMIATSEEKNCGPDCNCS